eukprot:1143354-Pelagomonas_calceolata.AAC.5
MNHETIEGTLTGVVRLSLVHHSRKEKRKVYASQKAACIKERFPDQQARKGLTKGLSKLS